jgi:hypothetical protein
MNSLGGLIKMPGDNRERVRLLCLAQLIAVLYYWVVISIFPKEILIPELQIICIAYLMLNLVPCIYLVFGDQKEARLYARDTKDNQDSQNPL